jgi:hypothetical protein
MMQVSLNFTALECHTDYVVAAAASDEEGNVVKNLSIAQVSTPDVEWPELVAGTPVLRATSHGSMWLDVALDEVGTVHVVVRNFCLSDMQSSSVYNHSIEQTCCQEFG